MGVEHEYRECVGRYHCMDQQLCDIIESDDKDKFVGIITAQLKRSNINDHLENILCYEHSNRMKIYDYLESMICCNATKCATGLLDHQDVELNRPLPLSQMPPLHVAAMNGRVELVKLFLCHNAQPDLRCKSEGEMYHDMLPLNFVLESIRTSKYFEGWTPKQSILKMLTNLFVPELRSRLEVVKLLCYSSEQIEMEVYYYANTGKLVELAALLMVAREKVMSPSFFLKVFSSRGEPSLNGTTTLCRFINTELTLLAALEANWMYRDQCDITGMCKEKQALKISMLLLFEVFERAGDDMEAYLQLEKTAVPAKQVTAEVACLLQRAGFSLNHEDIDWSHDERTLPLEFDWRDGILSHLLAEKIETPQLYHTLAGDSEFSKVLPDKERELNPSANCKRQNNVLAPYSKWRMDSAQYLDEYLNFVLQSFSKMDDARSKLDCGDRLKLHNFCSLYEALDSLCDHQYIRDWRPEKSIFKLVYILCSPELRNLVDKVRSLACNMEQIGEITCLYAQKRKIVEFATLLMVAREKLMPLTPSHVIGDVSFSGSTMIRQCIMSEIQSLVDKNILLIYSCQRCLSHLLEGKKMLQALQLVELFENAGADIDRFCQMERYKHIKKEEVAEDLEFMFMINGFRFKQHDLSYDDINCFSFSLGEKETEALNRRLEKATATNIGSQLRKFPPGMEKHGAGTNRCNILTQSSRVSPSPCFTSRLFSTFQISRFYSCLDSSLAMGSKASETTKRFASLRSHFLFIEKCSYLALAIKRGIKRI